MIDVRKRPLLEQAAWLLKKPVSEDFDITLAQLILARDLVEKLSAEVRRLEPQQMAIR